jgi:hypothetical protein
MDVWDAITSAKKRIADIDSTLRAMDDEGSPTQRKVDKPHIVSLNKEREYLVSLCFFATEMLTGNMSED